MAHNWLNDTSRELNNKIYQRRLQGPSLATISNWHKEFLAQGLDHRMSFVQYRKTKMTEWFKQQRFRLNKKKKISKK